jgi:hypothetical protein
MKPTHRVMFVAGLLVLAAITWGWLTRAQPQADWLQVEAPARVAPGERITFRVTPVGIDEGLRINVDLHGTTQRQHPLRLLSHGRPQQVGPPGKPLDFLLSVPTRPDLATVHAIIYVSPSGGWTDRTRLAHSDPIPVRPGPAAGNEATPLPVHEQIPDPAIPRVELTGVRYLIASLWILVAAGLTLRPNSWLPTEPTAPRPRFVPLILACITIAFAELFRIEIIIGDAARRLAVHYDFYDERLLPQQIAILVLIVGLAALAGFILIRARQRRLVIGLIGHAAIAATAAMSLHDADALLYGTRLGLPLEQLLKLGAATLALWGLRPRFTALPAPPSA